MIVIVKQHEIFLKKEEEINEKEVNISKCIFEFDEEITDEFIKEAIFVKDDKTIVKIINNNECDYPPEILDSVGACLLGVVATLTEGEEIVKRFNPTPKKFFITEGILREADNSEPITASELKQYQQALQNGLNEVKAELQRVIETGNTVASQGQYAQEQGGYAKEQAQIIIDSNAAATKIIKEFEENVEQHTTNFNENATTQTTNYNDNAKEKLETYNSNAETKTTDFNKNASDKTKTFNENVETKITDYNANSGVKIKAYDDNAIAKLKEYNDNVTLKVEEYNSNATEKLENYNSNATAKTEEFNQNANNYEKRITENEKEIIDIESYLDSLTPKASAKGELVHITDALNLPTFENKVSGNVKQETTRGVQLFDLNYAIEKNYKIEGTATTKTYYTIDNNGYLNATFTNATVGTLYLNKISLKAGTYTLQYKLNLTTTGERIVFVYAKNFSTITTIIDKTEWDLGTGDISRNFTFTLSEDSEISFAFTPKNGTSTLIIKDIQLESGEVVTDVEKYTGGQASPNPEFPQEVEVIEGDLSYKVNGKNLIDIVDDIQIPNLTFKKNEDKTFLINGTLTSFTSRNIAKPEDLEPGAYTISLKINDIEINADIYYLDSMGKQHYLYKGGGVVRTTFNENVRIISINAYFSVRTYTNEILSLQIEQGEVATPYEPYQEQIVPLDLKGNWVGAINDDIKDYLVTDKKKFWLVKNTAIREYTSDKISKVTLVTYDNIDYAMFGKPIDYIGYNKTTILSKLICDKAIWSNDWYDFPDIKNIGKILETPTGGFFWIGFPKGTTEEEMKEKLSNLKVLYQLTTPKIIELGELPEPIKTFEGTNNIQVLANLDTEIEVKYALDLKKYYDNKLAEISAQII